MKFDIILFDLDGTLIRLPKNFMDLINRLVIETCKELGIKKPIENVNELWYSGENYKNVLINWGIKEDNISNFWKIFDEKDFSLRKKLIKTGKMGLYSDTIPVLEKIKNKNGLKLGIISNSPPRKANYELNIFNLDKYFDCKIFLGSINQQYAKPAPYGIWWCLDKLKNEFKNTKNKVCFIGDSEIDIIAGKKANVTTAFIIRDHNKYDLKNKPDIILNSLFELIPILD